MKPMDIYETERKKCNEETLKTVADMIKQGIAFPVIAEKVKLNLFDLGPYIEVAFKENDISPEKYLNTEKLQEAFLVIGNIGMPLLKTIKNALNDEYNYNQIRVIRGIYFRTTRNYIPKREEKKIESVVTEQVLNLPDKIDISSNKAFYDAINSLKTEKWRQVGFLIFKKICPKQFFVLPAAMRPGNHRPIEMSIGAFDSKNPDKIERIGGKAFHSLRVLEIVDQLLETDAPEIYDWNHTKVVKYVYGNEFSKEDIDIIRLAALCHDIYSGGTDDEADLTRKGLDKMHPYYHRENFKILKNAVSDISDEKWDLFFKIMENHMWKWSPKELTVTFKASDPDTYRATKIVEYADYLSDQKTGEEYPIFSFLKFYEVEKGFIDNLELEEFERFGITKQSLINDFGHCDIDEIIRIYKITK